MKPGDKVELKKATNRTVGTIMRPAALGVTDAWVVKVNDRTEIVAPESELETVS